MLLVRAVHHLIDEFGWHRCAHGDVARKWIAGRILIAEVLEIARRQEIRGNFGCCGVGFWRQRMVGGSVVFG